MTVLHRSYNERFVQYTVYEEIGIRVQLASNLRRLRVARHLSLSELARTTGTSKATLSGIEHARANPTIDTLTALAGALNVSLVELLEEPDPGEVRIVRANRSNRSKDDRSGGRLLDTFELDGRVELSKLHLPAGHSQEAKPGPAGARVHLLVLQGPLIAGPVDRISELDTGDYSSFPADVPYVYETTRAAASALVATCTPQ
jgi:transcriptional regulator with XRE-family HTH domain